MQDANKISKELHVGWKVLILSAPFLTFLTLFIVNREGAVYAILNKLTEDNYWFYILLYSIALFGAQLLSGGLFNKLYNASRPKRISKKILSYIYLRILVLTYSLYEFLGYLGLYLVALSISLIAHSIEHVNSTPGKLSISIVLTSFLLSYLLGVLVDSIIKKFKKSIIDNNTIVGKFISTSQNQFCNIILVLSVAITIYGIVVDETSSTESSLFMTLSFLVIGSICFQTVKSNLSRFFHLSFMQK